MTREPTPPTGLSDDLLQRYFDDALSSSERADVEARLDADGRLRLEALAELRSLLRDRVTAEASTIDFSSTIDAIEKTERARSGAAAPRRRGLLAPLTAIGGFLAAGAAVFLLWRPSAIDPQRVAVAPPAVQSNEAEVETLEMRGAVASVFTVDDEADPASRVTVIWADDADEDGEEQE